MSIRIFLCVLFTLSFGVRSDQTIDYLPDGQRLSVKRSQRLSRALDGEEENGTKADATPNAVAASDSEASRVPRVLALTLRTVTKDVSYAGKYSSFFSFSFDIFFRLLFFCMANEIRVT